MSRWTSPMRTVTAAAAVGATNGDGPAPSDAADRAVKADGCAGGQAVTSRSAPVETS